MTRIAWFGVWAISVIAAFWIGARERSSEQTAPAAVSVRPSVTTSGPARCAVDDLAIRRAVSDAMAAKEHAAPAIPHVDGATRSESEEPEFDVEVADRAYKRGSEILDHALARGTWTREDAGDLRLVILQLPKDQRHSLLDRLFGAVNDNQLRNDVAGAPI